MAHIWIVAAIVFAISFLLTPILRSVARRRGSLDLPNEASSHSMPTPRNGGFAVLAGVIAALAFAQPAGSLWMVVIPTLLLAMLAIVDEFRPLRRTFRLVAQIAIVTMPAVTGGNFKTLVLPFMRVPVGTVAAFLLAIVWLIGTVNGFNFMDGLNGLAASAAIICGMAEGILFLRHDEPAFAIVALGAAAAAAGFLPWNLPSGSIFMGDVGSVTLGFVNGVLVLRLLHIGVPLFAAILPLASFLSDALLAVIRRAVRGERFFATRHRSHYYQWLNQQRWSHAAVTGLWTLLVASSAAAALVYERLDDSQQVIVLAAVVGLHVGVFVWISVRQRRAWYPSGPSNGTQLVR